MNVIYTRQSVDKKDRIFIESQIQTRFPTPKYGETPSPIQGGNRFQTP